jgi:hypothetical protein
VSLSSGNGSYVIAIELFVDGGFARCDSDSAVDGYANEVTTLAGAAPLLWRSSLDDDFERPASAGEVLPPTLEAATDSSQSSGQPHSNASVDEHGAQLY